MCKYSKRETISLKFQRVLVGYLHEAPKEVLNYVGTEKPPKYYAAQRSKAPNPKSKDPENTKPALSSLNFDPNMKSGEEEVWGGGWWLDYSSMHLCKNYMLFVR